VKKLGFIGVTTIMLFILFTACPIDGGDDDTIYITGVTIMNGNADAGETLAVAVGGADITLTAVVLPAEAADADKAVDWESSNPAIATVADGVVRGVAAGKTTITVTTAGKKKDGEFATDTIVVTVSATPPKVTGISIQVNGTDVSQVDVYEGSPITLAAVVSPASASEADKAVTWSSANSTIVTVEETTGVVTWVAEGETTVTATTAGEKEEGGRATATVTVYAKGTPKLVIYNKGTVAEGTTTTLPELVNNRYTIINASDTNEMGGSWDGDTSGKTLIYLDTPVSGDFEMTARVRVVESQGATGNKSAVLIGALLDAGDSTADSAQGAPKGNTLWFGGIRVWGGGDKTRYLARTSGSLYTSNAMSAGTGGNGITSATFLYEYLYKIIRADGDYTLKVYDTKYPDKELGTHTIASGQNPQSALSDDPVYPGFILAGIKVEISNVIIKEGAAQIFSSGESAYTPVAATGITLSAAGAEGAGGYDYVAVYDEMIPPSVQLVPAFVPPNSTDDITWSGTGANATVDQTGLVTFTGAGEYTVKAEITNNPTIYGEYKFNILAAVPPVTVVAISGPSTVQAGFTITLSAEVDVGANQEVAWSSSDQTIATVDPTSGLVTGVMAGTVTITATSPYGANNAEVLGTHEVTVTPAEGSNILFSWRAVDAGWDAIPKGTSVKINDIDVAVIGSSDLTKKEDGSGYVLNNARFVIGSSSQTATANSDTSVAGTLNLSKRAKVTVEYSESSGSANFQIFVNNNTTSSGSSIFNNKDANPIDDGSISSTISRVHSAAPDATGGKIEVELDPSNFVPKLADNPTSAAAQSLSTAFVSLRAESARYITITSITIEYVTE
jgi:uncharacterized protein YjdB